MERGVSKRKKFLTTMSGGFDYHSHPHCHHCLSSPAYYRSMTSPIRKTFLFPVNLGICSINVGGSPKSVKERTEAADLPHNEHFRARQWKAVSNIQRRMSMSSTCVIMEPGVGTRTPYAGK